MSSTCQTRGIASRVCCSNSISANDDNSSVINSDIVTNDNTNTTLNNNINSNTNTTNKKKAKSNLGRGYIAFSLYVTLWHPFSPEYVP